MQPLILWHAVQYLLKSHFPESLHSDLLEALKLGDVLVDEKEGDENDYLKTRSRDPSFRPNVILAYKKRCAICGYNIDFQNRSMGLEAAHILWHSSGGPDVVSNGLALCAIHHRAFDRGGIGLGNRLELLVSAGLHGQGEAWNFWFKRFEGKAIQRPLEKQLSPDPVFLNWHRRQVFRDFI